MIKKIKMDKIQYPVHEHLDTALKCTYKQRLQWLEGANQFSDAAEKARKKLKIKK